jgi:hypothetical protein
VAFDSRAKISLKISVEFAMICTICVKCRVKFQLVELHGNGLKTLYKKYDLLLLKLCTSNFQTICTETYLKSDEIHSRVQVSGIFSIAQSCSFAFLKF